MIRRAFLTLAVVVLALAASERVSARAAGPDVRASRYDVTLDLRPDGALDVVERITLTAGSVPITFFERKVPARHTDGLTNVVALLDGREVRSLDNGVGVRIRPGDATVRRSSNLDVRWQFAPTSNASHTFELRYRALHVVSRDPAGPRLQWSALPTEHTYPVDAARVVLRAPQGTLATAMTAAGGDMQPATSWQEGLQVTRNGLGTRDGIALDVTFSVETFRPAEPEWSVIEEHAQRLMPAFVVAGITLIVIGAGTLIMIRIRTGRSTVEDDSWAAAPAEPGDAAPAVASALLQRGQTGGWLPLQAAFFRLVRDGHVVVEKAGVRVGAPGAVAPHEQWVIATVAEGGTTNLRRLAARFNRRQRGFHRILREDMQAQGVIDADRATTSRGLRAAGLVLLGVAALGAMLLGALFVDSLGPALLAIPAGVFVDALAFMIAGQTMSTLSDGGVRASRRWQQRVAWMREVLSQNDGNPASRGLADFQQWLPLAIGAGLGKRWVKSFASQLREEGSQIEWLRAMGSPADALMMIDAMVVISSASHSGGGAAAGAGAGGGSSSAG